MIEEILNKVYTSDLLSSEELHELTEWVCNKDKEIERLKDKLYDVQAHYETEAEAKYYEFIDNHESKLQQRINKAIEYIENKDFINYKKGLGNLERMLTHRKDLLDILKGDDKE